MELEALASFLRRPHGLLINGEEIPAVNGTTFDTVDPATSKVLTAVADAGEVDVDLAVGAARSAFDTWSGTAPAARAELLWQLGSRVEELSDEFATLETLDNGKPLAESLAVDIPLFTGLMKYYAGWATKIEGQSIPTSSGAPFHVYTRRESVGVVGAIIPWNFPLLMCGYKLGPALAAGNTVVLKPAEQTPLSALRLGQVMTDVGFPPGVVNIVTGFGPSCGGPLAAHADVDKVTFTGETDTGRAIMRAASGNMKRLSLELGGKSPSLVFADADLDAAVEGTFGAVFFNQGQCCIAGARVYVEDSVHDEFVDRLVARVEQVRLGSGLDPQTTMGPLVSAEQRNRVEMLVASGLAEGARPAIGGRPVDDPARRDGYFVAPTVLTDVRPDMRVMREEIFGPVALVSTFRSEDEAIRSANDTAFGLAAGVWTRDIKRGHRVAAAIRAGVVWVNSYGMFDVAIPYGGFGLSGFGKELGREAMDAYLETKTVWVDLS